MCNLQLAMVNHPNSHENCAYCIPCFFLSIGDVKDASIRGEWICLGLSEHGPLAWGGGCQDPWYLPVISGYDHSRHSESWECPGQVWSLTLWWSLVYHSWLNRTNDDSNEWENCQPGNHFFQKNHGRDMSRLRPCAATIQVIQSWVKQVSAQGGQPCADLDETADMFNGLKSGNCLSKGKGVHLGDKDATGIAKAMSPNLLPWALSQKRRASNTSVHRFECHFTMIWR